MAEYEPLLNHEADEEQPEILTKRRARTARVASLDVFRGLSVFLMMLVDAGSVIPIIAHSPWNGVHLADFGSYMEGSTEGIRTFLLGVLLQGGYLHGITSLTFGVDIERIRWLGILQRISIGYIVAALCEIWLPCQRWRGIGSFRNYSWHWFIAFLLSAMYLGLSYGLYVPDWQFKVLNSTSSFLSANGSCVYKVTCSIRGDLEPACNSAGMIDRYVLGINHLYTKPVYRNLQSNSDLKECNISKNATVPESSPSWCHAPFDPEGILSTLTAAVTSIIGLQYGHVFEQLEDHKERLGKWLTFSFSFLVLGLFLVIIGIPLNKSLYTISYMLVTCASAGITFSALYILVDVYKYRRLTFVLEWMGKHSLSIFVLVTSNLAVIAIQGFFWTAPENNIIHWIVTHFVHT